MTHRRFGNGRRHLNRVNILVDVLVAFKQRATAGVFIGECHQRGNIEATLVESFDAGLHLVCCASGCEAPRFNPLVVAWVQEHEHILTLVRVGDSDLHLVPLQTALPNGELLLRRLHVRMRSGHVGRFDLHANSVRELATRVHHRRLEIVVLVFLEGHPLAEDFTKIAIGFGFIIQSERPPRHPLIIIQ